MYIGNGYTAEGWGGGEGDFINQNMGFDHDSRNAKLQINSSSVEVNLPYWHNASTYICIYKAILFALLLIFTSYNVFTCHMTCFLILLYFVVVNAVINIIHCLLIIVLNLYNRLQIKFICNICVRCKEDGI